MAVKPDDLKGATLAKYVRDLWGDKVRLVPSQTIAVLTTPTRVYKNNPRRFLAIIVNQGTGQVFIDWNNSVAVGAGLPLAPQGGTLILTAFEDGELCAYELVAIASAAGNNLSVWEVETL